MNLDEALHSLDSFKTPAQIRDFFLEEGIMGQKGRPRHCPVAQYLQKMTGQETIGCSVGSAWTQDQATERPGRLVKDKIIGFPNNNITKFIAKFDNNEYPELIEGRTL